MNDRPENRPAQGETTFLRFLLFPLVALCVIVIAVVLGMAAWSWLGADSSPIDRRMPSHEFPADKGAAAGLSGAPVSSSVQAMKPVPDGRSAQAGGNLPFAVEATRSDQVDAETAVLRANPPTLLDAMMRAQTEQGKPGQGSRGNSSSSSAASPFRHDQGDRR